MTNEMAEEGNVVRVENNVAPARGQQQIKKNQSVSQDAWSLAQVH